MIGDGQVQSGVGVRQDGDPRVGVHCGAVVHVRADVDLLDPQIVEPVAELTHRLATPAPRGGLGVAAAEDERLGVLGDVREDVGLVGRLAYRLTSPYVLGAPVPTLPTVGVAGLRGAITHQCK